ncbi:RING finger protein 151-like isoform 2-T2 [Anomaloglossus baeobatrachus]|uniref:RING finger protein 151-like isoform X1 n=2 Tax=Anomaloglossus baeobatrachus TaxID=238106 RepID=UPI003F500393
MGYDIERFLGYVNEGLLCCICRDVLERPLQAPCEHAFCASCIHGWLVHHNNCPEDRHALTVTDLRALHRYMRNDLSRLQIQCKNYRSGCEMVCSLESIDKHERECEHSRMSCINAGCPIQFERRHLDSHLAVCEHRSRECPNGCGYAILSAEDLQHNCIAELRTELELLRSEMICRVEETKQEMESRLDSQRRHMVQKESLFQAEIEQLKSQMSQLQSEVRTLMVAENRHRQDLEQTNLEKRELRELLKGLQREGRATKEEAQKSSTEHSSLGLEILKRRTREVSII